MVGVARSGRCDNCRKRKVKCDQVKPTCGQCLRAGWKCPGYRQRNWQFRNEGVAMTEHAKSQPWTERNSVTVTDYSATSRWRQSDKTSLIVAPSAMPWSEPEQLCSNFCWSIHHQRVAAKLRVLPVAPYLEVLPIYIGHDKALDDAISCTLLMQRPISNGSHTTPLKRGRLAYSQALQSLRHSLASSETLQPTTLAAVMVLLMFENYTDPTGQSMAIHTKGLISAIRKAGPKGLDSSLSQLVLNAALGSIVLEAIMTAKDTFLNSPAWVCLLKSHEPHHAVPRLMRNLCLLCAPFSGLLERYNSVSQFDQHVCFVNEPEKYHESMMSSVHGGGRQRLIVDMRKFQSDLQNWVAHDKALEINDKTKMSSCEYNAKSQISEDFVLRLSFRCLMTGYTLMTQRMIYRIGDTESGTGSACVTSSNDEGSIALPSKSRTVRETIRRNDSLTRDLAYLDSIDVGQASMVRWALATLSSKVDGMPA